MTSALIEAARAGRVVLAPSNELAAALFDALERAYRSAGLEVWPTPRVRDFSSWLKERHLAGQLLDSSSPRCMSEVEERELWRKVVLESEAAGEFLEPSGAARAARRARRAMYEYGIRLEELRAHDTDESRALEEWSSRYAARCRALNCVGADALLGALEQASPEPRTLAWIESPLWRPVARRWLQRHAGAPLEPASIVSDAARHSPRLLAAPSREVELAAMAAWTRRELEADPEFRAFIVIPDLAPRRAEVIDAFDAELAAERFSLAPAPQSFAYAVAGGTALADYPPVRAALDLVTVASGAVAFERFSALLRAPELCATAAEASAVARLDSQLRRHAPSEQPLGHWLALAARVSHASSLEPPPALARLETAARALAQLHGNQPMSRWLSVWIEAFEAAPWSQRRRWSSAEFQSGERLRELLTTLALGDQVFGSLSREAAEQILKRAARDTPFQAQTGVPPVWITSAVTDPWLSYGGLWITGCDEKRWPPPADPIPLIPVALQRRHGVVAASAETQLTLAQDLQRRWLERAAACTFSCADAGEGQAVRPSALIRNLARIAVPSSRDADICAPPLWNLQRSAAPPLQSLLDEQAPAFESGERTRGVATLKAQSRCAFRGFAETRLAADLLERPRPGFNERERGELLHDALDRIWRELRDSNGLEARSADPAAFEALLRDSAARALEKLCRRRDPGRRWREREAARLQGLLGKWLELERQRSPFVIEAVEEGAEIARHAGLDFRVRVDRIDRLPDGARVVLDYKTGGAPADWRGERPDNPQLPVYALLHPQRLVAVAYGRVNAAGCEFRHEAERDNIFPNKRKTELEEQGSFAELLRLWERRIERIAGEFARGSAQVNPTASACRTCRLQGLCRVPSALDVERAVNPGGEAA